MSRIDAVDLRSVMNMDWEGPGAGASGVPVERVAEIKSIPNLSGEVRLADLARGADSGAVVQVVAPSGPNVG